MGGTYFDGLLVIELIAIRLLVNDPAFRLLAIAIL